MTNAMLFECQGTKYHNSSGTVVEPIAPRYYTVSVPSGIIRRNCVHLHHLPDNSSDSDFHTNCRVTRVVVFLSHQLNGSQMITLKKGRCGGEY